MLSDRFIKNAKQGKYADENGLYLVVYSTGAKSFVLRKRIAGKDHTLTLGQYPALGLADARKQAEALRNGVERRTVREAFDEYYEQRLSKDYRDPEQSKRMIEKDLLPFCGDADVASLQRADYTSLLQKVVRRGSPIMANRLMSQVRRFLEYCEAQGWIDDNPLVKVNRKNIGGKEKPKNRNLSFDDLAAFLKLLRSTKHDTSPGTRWALYFCVATGARATEALYCLTHRVLHIPEFTAGAAKTAAHTIPATPHIRAILKLADRQLPRDHRVLSHALRRLHQDFSPHDLRHTLSSRLADLGVMPHVVEKLLNHQMVGVMAVYNHAEYWPERNAAMRLWGRKLSELRKKDPE